MFRDGPYIGTVFLRVWSKTRHKQLHSGRLTLSGDSFWLEVASNLCLFGEILEICARLPLSETSSKGWTRRPPSSLPNHFVRCAGSRGPLTPPAFAYLKRGREPLDVGNRCFVSALQGRHGTVVHDGGLLCALGEVLEGSQTWRLSRRRHQRSLLTKLN